MWPKVKSWSETPFYTFGIDARVSLIAEADEADKAYKAEAAQDMYYSIEKIHFTFLYTVSGAANTRNS
jgi:hypothetical protein